MKSRVFALAFALGTATVVTAPVADAFCGFYVAGANDKLFNNATTVVLMRKGTRTVLSMQNNYQGPPEDFAMVIPVPIVLLKDNVKTLPAAVFDKIDKLASPRLVEYWEQDPCATPEPPPDAFVARADPPQKRVPPPSRDMDLGVAVEAQFSVGEYEVVVLSARDSAGLDTWLRQEKYKIPAGAEPILRPYVQGGSKFFVAKVDTKKVRFENGQAKLSPLRFHYDSETFALPVRLGLMNSSGTQDLIVHILAQGRRYEAANYPNVAIPTNLDVKDEVRKNFPAFYAALFDRTLARQPKAVVTEYAWDSRSCDPCPGPRLDDTDLMTLGMDEVSEAREFEPPPTSTVPPPAPPPGRPVRPRLLAGRFVLTRLHLRYGKEGLGEDLVFRQVPPIAGGREFLSDGTKLETGAVPSHENNFQARYAIRHVWTGPVACANPRRGIWGGPPGGAEPQGVEAAQNLAFAKRGGFDLAAMVARDDNETKIDSGPLVHAPAMYQAAEGSIGSSTYVPPSDDNSPKVTPPTTPVSAGGCAGCRVGETQDMSVPFGATIAAAVSVWIARIKRRKNSASPNG